MTFDLFTFLGVVWTQVEIQRIQAEIRRAMDKMATSLWQVEARK
jgi:hypothetical protein